MENEIINTRGAMEETLMVTKSNKQYCSLVAKTAEEKVALYNAINTPAKALKESVNIAIAVRHVFAEEVTFVDTETGEATPGVRIVLIDKDGVSYGCASKGVFNAINKIFAIFGEPSTWKQPLKMVPKIITKGSDRSILTLELG